ncbi:MAG: prepilin-type N-terminal cleavage/methylation domain-containing protein [Desulfobacteraceae bacterium]|nr:prepilin-type N-terminal cleavage/methylation domain-containing protein [Desulfobacteraceae bacterium]
MSVKNSLAGTAAFTLIELIVVISLIGIMLFFAVPRLDRSFLTDDSRRFSGWLLANVRALKNSSFEKHATFALYLDLEGDRAWNGPAGMGEDGSPDNDGSKGISLPGNSRLTDVMFSEQVKVTSGIVRICFYPGGYSDRAIIHVRKNDGSRVSYRIEPFLPDVSVMEGYAEF